MSYEEDVDVYGECRNFIKFCKEQGIQVTSEAVATVWAGFLTSVAIEEDEEDTTLDDYSIKKKIKKLMQKIKKLMNTIVKSINNLHIPTLYCF